MRQSTYRLQIAATNIPLSYQFHQSISYVLIRYFATSYPGANKKILLWGFNRIIPLITHIFNNMWIN